MEKWFNRGNCLEFEKERENFSCPKCGHYIGIGSFVSFWDEYECPTCDSELVIWRTVSVNFYILKREAPKSIQHLIKYIASFRPNGSMELYELMNFFGTQAFLDAEKLKNQKDDK